MDVLGHELGARDVRACARLLAERYPEERFDYGLMLKVLPVWAAQRILKGWVVKDAERRLLCFGASVFVTDEYAERLAREAVQFAGAELVRNASSHKSPVCAAAAKPTSGVKSSMMQGFLRLHRGYRVNRIFVEAFNARERSFYAGSGFAEIPSSNVMVLTREFVVSLDIHPLLPVFTNAAPKCQFSVGEQAMLEFALEGHTDDELAPLLNVSLSAIKKRWASVFQRAELTIPEMHMRNGRVDRKRGAQKRHLLLRYLRDHPEELKTAPVARDRLALGKRLGV